MPNDRPDALPFAFEVIPAGSPRTGPKKPAKPKKPKREKTPPTVPALVKSARQLMRKDKGLNGELDRLPALTWLLLLKLLDDREAAWEGEAKMARKPYVPVIEPPYRWRDWARDGGPTGPKGPACSPTSARSPGRRAAGSWPACSRASATR